MFHARESSLGWQLLEKRRSSLRLKYFYIICHCTAGIKSDLYIHTPNYALLWRDGAFKVKKIDC